MYVIKIKINKNLKKKVENNKILPSSFLLLDPGSEIRHLGSGRRDRFKSDCWIRYKYPGSATLK
jgi:hypothetical protein